MAARLTVIVSQSATGDSSVADMEETLVAELLMSHGLDANLVGPLEAMSPESTDLLCISGFRGSLAVVSWLSTDALDAAWKRLELGGEVRAIGTPPSGRRVRSVIHFPIQATTKIADLTRQLKKLLDDQAVKTVGIGGLASPIAAAKKIEIVQPRQDGPVRNLVQGVAPSISPASDANEETDAEDWPALDQLVDDFDALDI